MTFANNIFGALGPFADDDASGDLEGLVEALVGPVETLYEIVGEENQEVSWSAALDPDRCPSSVLPWLAQWVGVRLDPDMTEAERRAAIKDREGTTRGRPATIRARVERTLTGTRRVIIRERTPGPYDLYIRTIGTETPDPAVTERAIIDQKPAGIRLDYAAATGITYIDLESDYATYGDIAATGMSYGELSETLP